MKSRNPVIEFDKLQMYFGEPYVIDLESVEGSITVYQPKIGEIVRYGEKKFYSMLNIFVTNTTSYRLPLWKLQPRIDWNVLSDFELFLMLYSGIDTASTKLIFGDLDFSKFEIYTKTLGDTQETVLYDSENKIEINKDVYHHFSQYLRNVFNIFPEEKLTKDPIMKQWFITKDERQLEVDKTKREKGTAKDMSIQNVISSCVNHPGFKYNLSQLLDVGVCEFYDSVKRLQIYESTTALMKGMYSGFVDGSKLKSDDYNFMKEI